VISIPFTPYHLGPSGLFGILFLKWVDLPTLLIASIILDVEPILVIVFNLPYPIHGFFHSFLGGFLSSYYLDISNEIRERLFYSNNGGISSKTTNKIEWYNNRSVFGYVFTHNHGCSNI